jgi:chromosome segregation ATPase
MRAHGREPFRCVEDLPVFTVFCRIEELLRLRSQLHLTELRINGLKKDDERFEGELHQVEERRKVLAFDRENLRAEASEAREKIVGHEAEMKVLEGRESGLNREMDDARRRGEATMRKRSRSARPGKRSSGRSRRSAIATSRREANWR